MAEGKSLTPPASQYVDLLPQDQDFRFKTRSRTDQAAERSPEQGETIDHRPRASSDSPSPASLIGFPTGTGIELALGIGRAASLDGLLSESDVVSIHTPLSAETTRLIDTRAIARIKPGALLVNTARGPIVDIDAALKG